MNQLPDTVGTNVAFFEQQRIRRIWLEDRWYFSVVDVVGLLAETARPASIGQI